MCLLLNFHTNGTIALLLGMLIMGCRLIKHELNVDNSQCKRKELELCILTFAEDFVLPFISILLSDIKLTANGSIIRKCLKYK